MHAHMSMSAKQARELVYTWYAYSLSIADRCSCSARRGPCILPECQRQSLGFSSFCDRRAEKFKAHLA